MVIYEYVLSLSLLKLVILRIEMQIILILVCMGWLFVNVVVIPRGFGRGSRITCARVSASFNTDEWRQELHACVFLHLFLTIFPFLRVQHLEAPLGCLAWGSPLCCKGSPCVDHPFKQPRYQASEFSRVVEVVFRRIWHLVSQSEQNWPLGNCKEPIKSD